VARVQTAELAFHAGNRLEIIAPRDDDGFYLAKHLLTGRVSSW
jgi:hypothetical protein